MLRTTRAFGRAGAFAGPGPRVERCPRGREYPRSRVVWGAFQGRTMLKLHQQAAIGLTGTGFSACIPLLPR